MQRNPATPSIENYIDPEVIKNITDQFHRLYYNAGFFGKTWRDTFWRGVPVAKCPLDLWVYQEIICSLKPTIIIECGTFVGGSAFFLASICDLIGCGKIITIDTVASPYRPGHMRIDYLTGSSTSKEIVDKVKAEIRDTDTVMVVLDSDHHKDHVLNELKIYSELVTKGNYLIVEDTNINGHPVDPGFGPGPMEAVEDFLEENRNFQIDRSKEKFFLTQSPKGYLKKTE
ncbi:MAG: cephalosporin hydroxylase [Candidatus Omnitrophica bacterium]|nr:cephalosporin hydroxylase [Candidatus Omnitrophota bacterium]